VLILCGITIVFGFLKIRGTDPRRRDGIRQCNSCSTFTFQINGCCSYCGQSLDIKKLRREETAIGIPNFFSLRREVNSKIKVRKAAFFLAVLCSVSIITCAYFFLPSGFKMGPLKLIVVVVSLPILYLHSRVWAAAACPKCKGNLQRLVEFKVDWSRAAQPAGVQGLPSALKAEAKVSPHCKSDFDHSPGRSKIARINGLRFGPLRMRHAPAKIRRAA
jgi:hypothetical protein